MKTLFLILLTMRIASAQSALAGEWNARLIRDHSKTAAAPVGLELSPVEIAVSGDVEGGEPVAKAVVHGKYVRDLWNLVYGGAVVEKDKKGGGDFAFETRLTGKVTKLTLGFVGPRGDLESDEWNIQFEGYESFISTVKAGGLPDAPPIRTQWKSTDPKLETGEWQSQAAWDWSENDPTLKVTVDAPAGTRFIKAEGARIKIQNEGRSLLLLMQTRKQVFAAKLQADGSKSSVTREAEVSLSDSRIYLLRDDRCVAQELYFETSASSKDILFLAMSCHPRTPNLWTFQSQVSPFGSLNPKSQARAIEVEIKQPEPLPSLIDELQQIAFYSEKSKLEAGKISVGYGPRKKNKKWTFTAGVGLTYAAYSEDPGAIAVSQLGITPKASVALSLSPKWDIGTSLFFNLLPIGLNTGSFSAARYYGWNTRVGYDIGRAMGMNWRIHTGTYFWGMLTSGSPYGVTALFGPQLFVSAGSGSATDCRRYGLYFKFAPTAESPTSISASNFEIALGGSVGLSGANSKLPLDATLDLSHTQIGASKAGINAQLTTASLGLQTYFFAK